MKVLLVGNGAREHIIAEKIAQDAELYSIMSSKNPAIAALSKKSWICDIHNPTKIVECIRDENLDLAFASPDAVLAAGVSNALQDVGLLVASPLKEAARIEWDKGFMRNLIKKHKVAGAIKFGIVDNEEEALRKTKEYGEFAIKPLGLTGGKGVKVSGDHINSDDQALAYIREVLKGDSKILIEEKVEGEEFSLQAFSDGKRIEIMPPVQDHKRAFENDAGPNTGGMGSYSSGRMLPFMDKKDLEDAEKIMRETIHAMKKEGAPFKGVLYGQFMITKNGVRIIEFNARFGDPEAMNVLALFKGSLTNMLLSIADENLEKAEFNESATVVKYLVPEGYPDKPGPNSVVSIDSEKIEKLGAKVYYASVYEDGGKVYTTKSRGFGIVGMGKTLEEAEKISEEACKYAHGPLWHRTDIGTAALVQKRIEHMKKIKGEK